MPDFCIICEFNPLHGGHKFLIDQARKMGADNVVCVMSGNATQRGELAVTDKYLRAEAAVKCGADLVLPRWSDRGESMGRTCSAVRGEQAFCACFWGI